MSGRKAQPGTALRKFARLESPGLWRDKPETQRREVIVAFREATLVLSDPKSETPLTHWSLSAVERLNPGALPALYGPDRDSGETLELDDGEMISALETVRKAIESQRPRPGRLRGFVLGAGTVLVLAAAVFWVPDALVRHTASVVPAATRAAIGAAALSDVQRLTGSPCDSPLGGFALTALSDQLFGRHGARILVLREGLEASAHLPGGVILVARRMVEQANGPEVLAGLAIAERLRAEAQDPLLPILRHAGIAATFRLLTTGSLPEGALSGYGEAVLTAPAAAVESAALVARFGAAGLSTQPYAQAIDPAGTATAALIAADPMEGLVPQPLMSDGDWVSLQDICVTPD